MTGQQQLVGALGVGLVIVNYWTSDNKNVITGGLLGNGNNTARAHQQLKVIGGELIFVALATLLAGLGDQWATVMVVVLVGLAILWATKHYSGGTATATAAASVGNVAGMAA